MMRIRVLLGVLVLGAAVSSVRADPAKEVARLITQLGSDQFAVRQEAGQTLDALGTAALEALRKAAQGEDPEVRRRASLLVRKIERRAENEKLLKAPKMRLVFKDTPLLDALAQLNEAVGGDFRFEGDKNRLAERKVTIDTGEAPFWESFDRLMAESGLVEKPGQTSRPRNNNSNYRYEQVIIINGQIYRSDNSRDDVPEGRVLLIEGKPAALPTHYVGPFRVRALPPTTSIAGQSKVEGEWLLALETMADPRMRWEKLLGIRIRRAVDDQGQDLVQVMTPPAERSTRYNNSSVMIVNGQVMNDRDTSSADPRQVPLRLRAGGKTAKKLVEVSGTVSGLVLLSPEKLLTVEGILSSAGKTTDGAGGSSFKVVEVTKDESGLVTVRAHVDPPVSELTDGTSAYYGGRIIMNGRLIGDSPTPLHGASYDLLDEKGQPYQFMEVDYPATRGGGPREVRLTFMQKKGQGEPAKLVFSARRGAVVDVPFTLKDVPLP